MQSTSLSKVTPTSQIDATKALAVMRCQSNVRELTEYLTCGVPDHTHSVERTGKVGELG